MIMEDRVNILENKMWRMEKLLWYVAGVISIKFGGEAIPIVSALIK